MISRPSAVVGQREFGMQPQRLGVIEHRLLEVAFGAIGVAAVVIGVAVLGIYLQRQIVVRYGAIVFSAGVVGVTAIGIGVGIARIQPDGLREIGDGLFQL